MSRLRSAHKCQASDANKRTARGRRNDRASQQARRHWWRRRIDLPPSQWMVSQHRSLPLQAHYCTAALFLATTPTLSTIPTLCFLCENMPTALWHAKIRATDPVACTELRNSAVTFITHFYILSYYFYNKSCRMFVFTHAWQRPPSNWLVSADSMTLFLYFGRVISEINLYDWKYFLYVSVFISVYIILVCQCVYRGNYIYLL